MNGQSRTRYRFGQFELDPAGGRLIKAGVRLRLQEQPLLVLHALLEHPGEVVYREDLQQRLWPDDTHVDYEDGLSTAVAKVRRALGDSASNPRFVETVPKRGYRFIAPVEVVGGETVGDESPSKKPDLRLLAAAGLVACIGLGLGLYIVSRILQSHNQEVNLKSEVGVGTTFEFHLPLAGRDS